MSTFSGATPQVGVFEDIFVDNIPTVSVEIPLQFSPILEQKMLES